MLTKPSFVPAGVWKICDRLSRPFGGLIVRLYALAILFVVLWAGYTAVAYLIRTVFYPTHVPPQFLTQNVQQDVTQLRAGQVLTATHGPIGHYHGLGRWFQADPHNGCGMEGCHKPLAHTKRKDIRAFVNFHSTFLACGMCHDATVQASTPKIWVNTATGQVQEPPALLQLMRLIRVEREKVSAAPAEIHPRILALLMSVADVIGGDPLLNYLLLQLNTSEPGSPIWRLTMGQLEAELPNQARGEYMAKIAPESTAAAMAERNSTLQNLAKRYFATRPGTPEREQLQKDIHANVLAKPEACLTCHGGEPPKLDLEALGYSPQRAAELRGSTTARMIQTIREGQPFYLPQFLEGVNAH